MRPPSKQTDSPPLAFDIDGAARAMSVGRTKIYEEIAAGRLDARKVGSRTIIPFESVQAWLNSLPRFRDASAA